VSYITNPDVAHEESDVAVRPLLWFVGGLTFFTLVVCGAMLLMFMYFQGREESQELKASPLARRGAERLPPEPRLQLAPGWQVQTDDGERHELSYGVKTDHVPQPWSEYIIVGDEWRRELEDYGWADEKAGTVRVPIEQAMRVYLQRRQAKQPPQGAPTPPAPNAQAGSAQQAPKETTPADSSSGQQPEQKHQ
jgi:hypothetical protein